MNYQALSALFSRPVFARLADLSLQDTLRSLLRTKVAIRSSKGTTLRHLFEESFSLLAQGYRSEYVFKASIANRLLFGRHSPRTAALQVEMQVGRSIADLAVFNGTSTAYEVKSEFDTARRLRTQTLDYLNVFDHVYLVTTQNCANKYADVVDPRVGILTLTKACSLSTFRPSISNRINIRPEQVFRCLRVQEYRSILNAQGVSTDFPTGVRRAMCSRLFEDLGVEAAHQAFVDAMRRRTIDKETASFVEALPPSLRPLGYATPLSSIERNKVLTRLSQHVNVQLATN